MKTTLDIVDVVYGVLENSSLSSEITGNIYKFERPLNSNLEDVVINSLPVTGDQLQSSIVNVNVFVPDMAITVNGQPNEVPDFVRLKELAQIAVDAVTDGISGDYTWDVEQQHVFKDEESGQYFINIRIQFFVSNI